LSLYQCIAIWLKIKEYVLMSKLMKHAEANNVLTIVEARHN